MPAHQATAAGTRTPADEVLVACDRTRAGHRPTDAPTGVPPRPAVVESVFTDAAREDLGWLGPAVGPGAGAVYREAAARQRPEVRPLAAAIERLGPHAAARPDPGAPLVDGTRPRPRAPRLLAAAGAPEPWGVDTESEAPMIQLTARAGHVETFEEFCTHPGPAVALDGYVTGPFRVDRGCAHVNFNHHEGGDVRFVTRATCEQVAFALRSGIARAWPHGLHAVYVNDADPDVCLAAWLLEHPDRVDEPMVDRLVRVEGAIDTTAATTLPADEDTLGALAWATEPWSATRDAELDDEAIASVVHEVGERIDALADGRGDRIEVDSGYERIFGVGPVVAIREWGPWSRPLLAGDGIEVFVAVRELPQHRHVTIGRTSPFVDADLTPVFAALNSHERPREGAWGGSDGIGGSPRRIGTTLTVEEIVTLTARVLGLAD